MEVALSTAHAHFSPLLQPCSAEADEVLGSAGAEAAAVGLLEPSVLPFQR